MLPAEDVESQTKLRMADKMEAVYRIFIGPAASVSPNSEYNLADYRRT